MSIRKKYRFRLEDSGDFVQALIEGDSVEMRFRGSFGIVQYEWAKPFSVSPGWLRRWRS